MHEPTVSLDPASGPAEGDLRLPRPPGVIRRFWARHPLLLDGLIVVVYLLVAAIGAIAPVDRIELPPAAPLALPVLVFGAAVLLLFRRSRPVLVLGVGLASALLEAVLLGVTDLVLAMLALYAVGAYRSTRGAWIGYAVAVPVGAVATALAGLVNAAPPGAPPTRPPADLGIGPDSISWAVLLLIVTLIGTNIGNRRRYLQALIDRAEQLARERDQQARLAAAAERSRIAREMHDIVSHSLTVMVTLAEGSAAAAPATPDRAAETMRQVAETGRSALADMRRMLGVLADDGPATPGSDTAFAPQPGAGELIGLVERFRDAGLEVSIATSGAPIRDAALEISVFRIVQESLTNVLRHAGPGSRAAVHVDAAPGAVTVRVDDDGLHAAGPVGIGGSGRGIVGMRERVALYGGEVEAGPKPGGGWRVLAVLPASGGDAA